MTTTRTAATQITMTKVFEAVIIDVHLNEHGTWMVERVGIYNTRQGGRVDGNAVRGHCTEAEAREYANGLFAHYKAKGYRRTA